MAIVSATFTFSLPEDTEADQLLIYEATSEGGVYSLVDTVDYEYGITSYEFDSTNDARWYKIKFNNSVDNEAGPLSEAVYGGNFDQSKPLLVVSTGTDGANYATTQDLYDYCNLTPENVSRTRASQALRRARALVDLRTAELDLDRFTKTFDSATARRKFNATLHVIREAEINLALAVIFQGMAEDKVSESFRNEDTSKPSISIGTTAIGEEGGTETSQHIDDLIDISRKYTETGEKMLAAIQPPSVRIHATPDGWVRSPRFKYPFNGY